MGKIVNQNFSLRGSSMPRVKAVSHFEQTHVTSFWAIDESSPASLDRGGPFCDATQYRLGRINRVDISLFSEHEAGIRDLVSFFCSYKTTEEQGSHFDLR